MLEQTVNPQKNHKHPEKKFQLRNRYVFQSRHTKGKAKTQPAADDF